MPAVSHRHLIDIIDIVVVIGIVVIGKLDDHVGVGTCNTHNIANLGSPSAAERPQLPAADPPRAVRS